jgi:hypothetical protein
MSLKNLLLGEPLATYEEGKQRVGPLAGIPMLGLGALASAAYGPEAAMTLLIPLLLRGDQNIVVINVPWYLSG